MRARQSSMCVLYLAVLLTQGCKDYRRWNVDQGYTCRHNTKTLDVVVEVKFDEILIT